MSYLQASDREDTGIASGTRNSPQVKKPRANTHRQSAERLGFRVYSARSTIRC